MRLSACLIVRNEEALLPRCLASIQPVVDEIVVVDTGSADRTPDLAREFGARVVHSPWRDDFSHHRNESLSLAGGDWAMVIDADEELETARPVGDIRAALFALDRHGAAVPILDVRDGRVVSTLNAPRFFRRNRVRYMGIVHNQPVIDGGEAVFLSGVRIRHYGYGLDPEKMAAKHRRTLALLEKQRSQGELQAHFYLAEQHGMRADWPACLDACNRYLDHEAALGSRFNGSVFFLGAQAAGRLGRDQEAHDWLIQGLIRLPQDGDLGFALAEWGVRHHDHEAAAEGARIHAAACRAYDRNPVSTGNRFAFTLTPEAYGLSLYRLAMTRLKQGADAWRELKARFADPDRWGLTPAAMAEMTDEAARNFGLLGLSLEERPDLSPVSFRESHSEPAYARESGPAEPMIDQKEERHGALG